MLLIAIVWSTCALPGAGAGPETAHRSPKFRNDIVRGRVGWLAPLLKEHFDISSVPEVGKQSLAILTVDGEVVPLVENIRGRAFRSDERLRDMDLEIWIRRFDQQPVVQVLRVFQLRDGQRFELDYWCDVCAIPMYETGPCECCQDQNRLREREVSDAEASAEAFLADSP